ncbi:MAG: DUF465 domain-containing protein [Hyphomicrobiales bacterium]|nr:DUF465 domain-containing protein [Hyphomicrobiales bacterium]MDE2018025.1 DUF465 domain-containing protein [Hyphomicrobiales bacterium]
MSVQAHLAELERRHQALERAIEEESHRAGHDDLAVLELKRKKLTLKDEITKLRRDDDIPAAASRH